MEITFDIDAIDKLTREQEKTVVTVTRPDGDKKQVTVAVPRKTRNKKQKR